MNKILSLYNSFIKNKIIIIIPVICLLGFILFSNFVQQWLYSNFIYCITLFIIFYLPTLYLQNYLLNKTKQNLFLCFFLLTIFGIYYLYFNIPDFVIFLAHLIKGYHIKDLTSHLFLSIIVWAGWTLMLLSISKIFTKNLSFQKESQDLHYKYYFYFTFLYIIYLNSTLAIIKPLFGR